MLLCASSSHDEWCKEFPKLMCKYRQWLFSKHIFAWSSPHYAPLEVSFVIRGLLCSNLSRAKRRKWLPHRNADHIEEFLMWLCQSLKHNPSSHYQSGSTEDLNSYEQVAVLVPGKYFRHWHPHKCSRRYQIMRLNLRTTDIFGELCHIGISDGG